MKAIEVQSPDLGYVNLVLNTTDEQGNSVSKTYKLIYDYRAIKRAEDALGIDLKDLSKWSEVKSSMTPQLVHAGLAKFHPEVTLDEVTDLLHPAAQVAIQNVVFELIFPGVLEKIEKLKVETEKETSPNVESEASDVA